MAHISRRIWLKLGLVSAIVAGAMAGAMPVAATPLLTDGQISESRLVGTWRLASYQLQNGLGEIIEPLGPDAQGQIIYDAAGNMSCHLVNPNPPERPRDVSDGEAYEMRISYNRYSSYYGPYDVDAANQEVHHRVIGSSMPGWAGTNVIRSYRFDGDNKLTLSASTGVGDQRAVLVWERVT